MLLTRFQFLIKTSYIFRSLRKEKLLILKNLDNTINKRLSYYASYLSILHYKDAPGVSNFIESIKSNRSSVKQIVW